METWNPEARSGGLAGVGLASQCEPGHRGNLPNGVSLSSF